MKQKGGASAAGYSGPSPNPDLEWRWAHNIALARDPDDDQVIVLIGTHGQVPIKQDGTFMPYTVQWDATKYPGTVCGVQSTLFGQVNFMADEDANQVAREITKQRVTITDDNAMVDFAERLKRTDTGMTEMRQGASFLDELAQRYDVEQQVLPLLTSSQPKEMDLLRYAAFRYTPTGVDDARTKEVSLLNKEFLLDCDEKNTARKTHNEWHINIFYKDIRGHIRRTDLFPLLVSKGAPLSKNRSGMLATCKVTNTQNIVDALHVAGFRNICIVDLTCFVFRQPLTLGDEWTLKGDHFSRILGNMIERYKYMLVKKGSVRSSIPGYAALSPREIQHFRSQYELLVQAVCRRDSAAVDGPRCAIQLAEITEAERKRIEIEISARRRKRRKNRRPSVAVVKVGTNKLKPKNLPVGSVRKLSIDTMLRNSAARAARLRLKPSKKSSMGADSSSMDTGNEFSTGSDSDSSMGSKNGSPGSPTTSMGGRRRTRKLQKRRKTNVRRRRGSRFAIAGAGRL
jgi:hypothetical protein